jgi:hypothetical protein
MESFGEALLRLGDTDLFHRVFHSVQREYLNQAQHSFGKMKQELIAASNQVGSLRIKMQENMAEYQVEEKNL